MFLYTVSAETQYASRTIDEHPELWRGVILFVPSGLPDPKSWPASQRRPRVLILGAAFDRDDTRLEQFQERALKAGVEADLVMYSGEGHYVAGNAAELRGDRAMADFVFGE